MWLANHMARVVNIHEAKTQLSKLIEEVERGEEVTIARAGVPCAKLVALMPTDREFDFLKDIVPHIPDSAFFDSLTEEELAAWEDSPIYPED